LVANHHEIAVRSGPESSSQWIQILLRTSPKILQGDLDTSNIMFEYDVCSLLISNFLPLRLRVREWNSRQQYWLAASTLSGAASRMLWKVRSSLCGRGKGWGSRVSSFRIDWTKPCFDKQWAEISQRIKSVTPMRIFVPRRRVRWSFLKRFRIRPDFNFS
jgi:hypothetical protein